MKKQKEQKKIIKKIILIILAVLFLSIIIALIVLNRLSTETEQIKTTKSLMTEQQELEKEFTSKGYTLDNPNIIVDPYHNSPLTALVIFETEESLSPTVTIEGSDELTTYTHEFSKKKTHYLPIYGLYPDKENKVIFGGRLGMYKYFDMDDTIEAALECCKRVFKWR